MKKLILVTNSKGGCGKTTATSLAYEYLASLGSQVALVDADPGNATLTGLYGPDRTIFVGRDVLGVDGRRQYDTLYELLGEHGTVLADLPAGAVSDLVGWADEADLLGQMKADGDQLVMVVPVTSDHDSVVGLRDLVEGFGDRVRWVVVVSHALGEPTAYLESKTRKKVLDLGGEEVVIPQLMPVIRDELHRAQLSFAAAIAPGRLPVLKANRLRKWREGVFAQLAATKAFALEPTSPAAASKKKETAK